MSLNKKKVIARSFQKKDRSIKNFQKSIEIESPTALQFTYFLFAKSLRPI